MRVNAIIQEGGLGKPHIREMRDIPVGAWAVILDDVQEVPNQLGDYIWQDQSYSYEFIMEPGHNDWPQQPNEILLRARCHDQRNEYKDKANSNHDFHGSCLRHRRVCFWSTTPFAVVQIDGGPWFNRYVFLARQVVENGLGCLPEFPLPEFIISKANLHTMIADRHGKWTRLSQVASLCRLSSEQILKVHMDQFSGYMEDGLLFLRSEDVEGVENAGRCEGAWSHPEQKSLMNGPHEDLWVTKHFALCVLYMHMVGYHKNHPELKAAA
jgi:hypothetical protein